MSDSSMDETFLRLAELIASRLCHDLSGPLNGLNAGLAMVETDPTLAHEAAKAATARLILLRAAWGEPGDPLGREDLARLAAGIGRSRITVDLSALDEATRFSPAAARLLLNVILLCAQALPRGGTVALRGDEAAGVIATAEGPNAAWPSGLAAMVADPAAATSALQETSPRGMQLALTMLMARACGHRVSLLLGSAGVGNPPLRITFTGP